MAPRDSNNLIEIRDFKVVRNSAGAILMELLHETGRSKNVWVPKQLANFRDYNRQLWLPNWFVKRYRIRPSA